MPPLRTGRLGRRIARVALCALAGLAGAALAVLPARADDQSVTVGGSGPYGGANNRFSPDTVAVKPGQMVTWTNAGGMHNVHFDDASLNCQKPDTPQQPSGWGGGSGKVSCTFANAGSFTYHCDLHGPSGMTGVVHVNASGTVPSGTTTSPGPGTTTAPGTTTSPGTGTSPGTSTHPLLSDLHVAPHQKRRVSGRVVIGQSGSQLEADLLPGSAGTAQSGNQSVLGRTIKRSLPAGRQRFKVALNRRGRRALARRGHLAVLLRIIVTPPSGSPATASARLRLSAR
jgi:plastocyanin